METLLLVVEYFVAGFGVLILVLTLYIIVTAYYYQVLRGPVLERELGFRHGSAYLPDHNVQGYISAVCVDHVVDDGVFAQAGFRSGDVLPDVSLTGFFKRLHHHRGSHVEFAVVDGGDGPPFRLRPRRVMGFAVPPACQGT